MTTLALIGVGAWGGNYLSTAKNISHCTIKYICTQSKETLATFSNKYIKTVHYQKLLDLNDIDGVIIATPASTHFKIASDFLKNKHNLLVEKPVATNYKDLIALQVLAKKSKSIFMVGHIYLYNPAFHTFVQLIKRVGNILYVSIEDGNLGPLRESISGIQDWLPHSISMCLEITQVLPNTITATGVAANIARRRKNFFDMAKIVLEFKTFPVFIAAGLLFPLKKRSVTVVGSKGTIVFDDTKGKKIRFVKYRNRSHDVKHPTYSSKPSLQVELEAFIHCIQARKSPKTDMNHAASMMKIIDSVQCSLETGKKIKLT